MGKLPSPKKEKTKKLLLIDLMVNLSLMQKREEHILGYMKMIMIFIL